MLLLSQSDGDDTAERREAWEKQAAHELLQATAIRLGTQIKKSRAEQGAAGAEQGAAGWKALERGDLVAAGDVATSLLEQAAEMPEEHWNYGNLLHEGHIMLGAVRLFEGDLAAAEAELRAAGQTPGSPQLDSFGQTWPWLGRCFASSATAPCSTIYTPSLVFGVRAIGGGTSSQGRPEAPRT